MESGNQVTKGKPFTLKEHVNYAIGSVVSKLTSQAFSGNGEHEQQ